MVLSRFLPTSLHNRVLILTLVGFLLSAGGTALLIFNYLQQGSIRLLVEQQQTMVDMVVRQMDSALQKRVTYLEEFTDLLHSRYRLHPNERMQEALKRDTQLHALFNGGVVVLNREGISLVDYPTIPNRTGIDYSDRKHLEKARRLKSTVITMPLMGKGLKSPLFAINTPILSDSGRVLGYIFGVNLLAQDNLLKEISRISFTDGGRVMVIDPNLGIYVTDTLKGVPLESYKKEKHCDCIERIQAGETSGITTDSRGNQIIYASAMLDKMGWVVIRTYPLSKAMSSINILTETIIVVILLISFMMAGLIAYLLRKLLTPLRNATRDIRKMAEGQLPEQTLTVQSNDEVGQLIRAFNQLHRNHNRYEQALRDSEERYRLTMEATQTGLWSWNLTNDSIQWDSQCYKMLGYQDQEFHLNRQLFRKLMHPEDQVRFYINFLPQVLDNLTAEIQFRLLTKDNRWLWIKCRGKPIRFGKNSHPICIAGTHMNFEQQRQTEQLRLAAAAFESNDAIMIVDADSKIVKVNNAFTQITGYQAEEAIGHSPALLRSGVHKSPFYEDMLGTLSESGKWQGEIWNRHKNGSIYIAWLNINTLFNDDNTVYQRIATFSDITEKKRTEELIWTQANFDPLTNLPNRRMFMDRLTQEIRLAARSKSSLALLFLDLDRFKEINDTLGHNVGDQLLIEVADRFKSLVRSSDTISRLGGDEFTIILPQIESSSQVEQVGEKILSVLKQPFMLENQQRYISASIGATLYPQDADNAEQLIKNADQAMYAAKAAGRSKLHFFTAGMQTLSQKRSRLINALREAIRQHQFQLYYQPVIDLESMTVVKAEALIRWNHPDEGLMFPHQFIQAAEQGGIIQELGDWIFREALQQVKQWRKQLNPQIQICINASPSHFEDSAQSPAHDRWIAIARESGLNNAELSIEITESLLMESSADTQQKLVQLRDANIQIGLDDFGTSFSSLAHLRRMDIDYLKIDRTFVRNLHGDSDDLVLCNAIIVMAHTLGIKVIAEGIETAEQHTLMQQANCDYGQGFFYASAMTARQFEQWHQKFSEQPLLLPN
ncbi:PAS domain S-box-containing protein/diguanylate cyclase (GGDEF) domain-containing protein [Amphritea atlantica]|uniref:PAS domain S-box-containing protein/diguanylate cyclase (GGDEF) domain-containing protein n=1 Tax=Amphritea atlantica TaxID=355243 RepID=A0A1H9DL64_9GAMM|nr:EAL domain-containing protein [Amphritea atlantica]SEQ14242.1 PAS domain S-box-containing protein/diguanylate cyclase (GGDEF) domain-containing protein [Amphritea atlantica]